MFSNGRLQFDGESKDVDNLINLYIYESLMFNWDRAAQVRAIECCLVEKALQIFNNLSQNQKTDIDEIIKALKADYESIATFCHEIERLLSKGMPGLEESSKSSLLRARLIAKFPENRPGHRISECRKKQNDEKNKPRSGQSSNDRFKKSNTFQSERRVHCEDRIKHNGKESYRSDRKDGFKKSQSFMIDAEWDEPEEEQVNSLEVACNGLK
ncbi:unnamed protein product, partial [Brachionus calyciflorus]